MGENVQRYPEVFRRLLAEGHTAGNHTHNHLNGWHTDDLPYFHNIRHCARQVKSDLFRPPYGRLKPSQRAFLERHYQIVMWDVLSGDFDPNITPQRCLDNVLENARNGSIVVLHDSLKAEAKLRFVLPRILEHYSNQGYSFQALR